MLIECPFCKATAKLPEEKENAKVRCSACGKVYVAREKGAKKKQGISPVTMGIAGGAVLVIAVFAFLFNNHKAPAPPVKPPPVVKAPEPMVDHTGWDSESVKFVRAIYDASMSYNEGLLAASLDGPRIAARLAATAPEGQALAADYASLGPVEQQAFLQTIAEDFMKGTGEDAPHHWKPVDGRALPSDEPNDVVVRVTVDKRLADGSTEIADSRTYDWHLTRKDEDSKWKAWAWERFLSDEEKRASRTKKKSTMVKLEDGTRLFQAEMRHLEPYPGTTPEVIASVEKAIATMLDFSLRPTENNAARDELVAIGKPAIPMLLNKFHEIKIVDTLDDPSLTQLNMVNVTLNRITGYNPGFNPMPGQTEERRTMALKAWFAWWERKGQNFTAPKVEKDLLEELIIPTEKEKREIEKQKAKDGG